MFEFVISNPFIICVVFGLVNNYRKPDINTTYEHELPPLVVVEVANGVLWLAELAKEMVIQQGGVQLHYDS